MPEPIQTPDEGTEETEVTTPQAGQEPVAPQATADVVEDTPTGGQPETTPSEPQPQTDYKQKFVESQREAILLNERNKVATTRIESLTTQDTPTDEAMRKLYPEWDQLDDYNKKVVIRQETTAMQQARIQSQQQDILDRQKLEDQLEEVTENPKYAKLKGQEAEFKRFAKKPANRGISAEVLAQAFLFDVTDNAPAPAAPAPRAEGLPTGSGGPREPLKPKKISLEEASQIRKTDGKRYMELAKSGQIDDDI